MPKSHSAHEFITLQIDTIVNLMNIFGRTRVDRREVQTIELRRLEPPERTHAEPGGVAGRVTVRMPEPPLKERWGQIYRSRPGH